MRPAGDKKRGVGIASCWYGCGNTSLPNPSTIKLGLSPDGQVVLHQGAVDIGQGSNTVIAQIAADALGLPLPTFGLRSADTAITPDAGKTSASRQTFVTRQGGRKGGRRTARKNPALRQCLGAGAALHLDGGTLAVWRGRQSTRASTLRRLTADADGLRVRGARKATIRRPRRSTPRARASPMPSMATARRSPNWRSISSSAPCKLVKITAAHDVGKAINPLLVEGQIEGGIAQGIGMALMEEYIPGRTENLHDYLIPTIGDVPPIETILVEVPDPEGPFGAKGLGEHVLIPTAPAILNAIRHATGRSGDARCRRRRRASSRRSARAARHERAFRTLRNA